MTRDEAKKMMAAARLRRDTKSAHVVVEGKILRAANLPTEKFGNRRSRRAAIARTKKAQ